MRIVLLLLVSSCAFGQTSAAWKASIAVHGFGTGFDSYSNWQRPESNRLLADSNGRFSSKGVAAKAGIFVGTTLLEYAALRLTKSRKVEKFFTYVNIGLGAGYSALSVRNLRMQGRL